jgi:hypothetical protein
MFSYILYCDQLPRVTILSDCRTCGLYRDWPPRVPDRWMHQTRYDCYHGFDPSKSNLCEPA